MKTRTKTLTLALCAVLLVVATVFVTMAFLTSQDSVTNTFTVGNVAITLDEAKVDTAGNITDGENRKSSDGRVKANEYHLIPGHTYKKDPTIHVATGSEDCWLFVKLENGLKYIIDATSIEAQMTAKGWELVSSETNIYAYNKTVKAEEHIEVFDDFKLKNDADVSTYGAAKIVVTAYAIQADGFDTAEIAWEQAGAEAQAKQ